MTASRVAACNMKKSRVPERPARARRSTDRHDSILRGKPAVAPFEAITLFPANELLAEWRLRGEDNHFAAVLLDLQPAFAGAEEEQAAFATTFEFDERGEIDGIGRRKFLQRQFGEILDG